MGGSPGSVGGPGQPGGMMAIGGDVRGGHLYGINELGMEMLIPGQDGRVLTANETSEMLATLKQIASQGQINGPAQAQTGSAGEVSRALYAIAKYCQRSARMLDKWDIDGMPEVRS